MNWHVLGDWGTSNLRLFRIEDGQVVDRADGPGIGTLTDSPAAALRAALAHWSDGPPAFIHLCGMAGAKTGLREAPYVDCPTGVDDWARAATCFDFDGVPVKIAPGVARVDIEGRPDVMRGEETQIFGALAIEPDLATRSTLFLLPGTHSKWSRIDDETISGFRTFCSGELFAMLMKHSTLVQAGVGGGPAEEEDEGFAAGLVRMETRANLASALFEARAAQLRVGRSSTWATGFLSGLLVGAEIVDMKSVRDIPDEVVIIGAPALSARYEQALVHFGARGRRMDGDACVLAGLALLDRFS
jgi:2-dehydro-3-deoxygalactonokinase